MLKKVQIFKALDIEIKKQKGPIAVKEGNRGQHSLKEELSQPGITVIGEVAGGNPQRGQVRETYRASTHAKSLVENGARALSVATDRFLYFGEDKHLSEVRNTVKVPLVRRDFIFEEYQIEESKILGADAVFLLVALLEPERLLALAKLAATKGLDVVMEVTSEADLKRALDAGGDIICVVARDLDTWEAHWDKALELLEMVPEKRCHRMVEASVQTLAQIQHLEGLGVHGVVVGDALLDEFYPGKRLAQILAGVEVQKKPSRSKAKPEAAVESESEDALPANPTTKISSSTPSQTARKGKKEFPMEHVQLPDATPNPVEATPAEPSKKPVKKAAAPKKAEPKKAAAPKKAEPKKAEPKKAAAPKKAEPKKAEPKKAEPKKAEPKKAEPKKAAAPTKAAPKK